ncbi:hypothetical protein F2Q70_00033688 [Brassica cretica]|uniref:V-type proton ATPase proteolipid subunit n=1 Tax=Brassica cretica TaxID=69181 RepID=A0A8S9JQS0_BRACR|nr:hypothetical protein F2Q70_00033688 [Brassica cretica]
MEGEQAKGIESKDLGRGRRAKGRRRRRRRRRREGDISIVIQSEGREGEIENRWKCQRSVAMRQHLSSASLALPLPSSSPVHSIFTGMGAAYGTAKSGVGVASMGVMRPELVMKSIVPVVMAGVLGIYGLIIAVIISTGINPKAKSYYLFDGYAHLSSGLACGLAGLSAGMAIGIVGDAGVSWSVQSRMRRKSLSSSSSSAS